MSLEKKSLTSEYNEDNPYTLFERWFKAADQQEECKYPNAMSLATADTQGRPSVRTVLLKGYDENGFVFYTNSKSRKGRELSENAQAGLCFYWPDLARQVRIEGSVENVIDAEADEYFASRPKYSQLGAWASQQSETLSDYGALIDRVNEYERKFEDRGHIPRPPHWTGYRVKPLRFEFWMEGDYRLHQRIEFLADGGGWSKRLIYP